MSQPLERIQIRDPYVLTLPESQEYLLFGSTDLNIWSGPATGFDCYRSSDLVDWEGPFPAFRPAPEFWSKEQYWAPEVHEYKGRYFMFATFTAPGHRRGTQIPLFTKGKNCSANSRVSPSPRKASTGPIRKKFWAMAIGSGA